MGRSLRISRILLLTTMIASAALYSCKDDVFNAEKVKATYQNKFPVKDIDPAMDWKTTKAVTIEVAVVEDYGVDYTVNVYDSDPLSQETVPHLLASGTANQERNFYTTVDCPAHLSLLYIVRTDAAGRRLMKTAYIKNEKLTASFGSKAETRAAESDIPLSEMTRPYTDTDIENLLASATEYKSGMNMDDGTKVFKITKDYKGDINHHGSGTPDAGSIKLIIAPGATWKIDKDIRVNQGLEVIVASRGKIELTAKMQFVGSAGLTVLGEYTRDDEDNDIETDKHKRGEITDDNDDDNIHKGSIEFTSGGLFYNAGKVDDIERITINGSTFFNYGEVDVDYVDGGATGSKLVNHGDFEVDHDLTGAGMEIENSCKLDVEDKLQFISLKMGRGSDVECDILDASGSILMNNDSHLEVEEEASFNNCDITGPHTGNYALIEIEKVTYYNYTGGYDEHGEVDKGYIINNIRFMYEKLGNNNVSWNLNYCLNGNNKKGNSNATLCKQGEAPEHIKADRCTGPGYVPNPEGGETPSKDMTYTYAFEDNYPLVGDYDFNDVVLDVSTEYQRERTTDYIKKIQLNVTLVAAGASKAVGVGLRLAGIDKQAIKSITSGGDDQRFHESLESKLSLFKFSKGNLQENNNDPYIIIPIAGEVHQIFDEKPGVLVNTGSGSTKKAYTYEIILELRDQTSTVPLVTKDNLDFFICYQYKMMEKRMEVHLYEFRKYGATTAGTILQETNLDLAGNNTWAISVPNFRYPKELINISDQENEDKCAYPEFINWARNRNTSQDWYLRPIEKNVYR